MHVNQANYCNVNNNKSQSLKVPALNIVFTLYILFQPNKHELLNGQILYHILYTCIFIFPSCFFHNCSFLNHKQFAVSSMYIFL